jgi:MFS family permease
VDRPFSRDPETERSLRHSLKDAVAFSVMSGAVETYFSAFALFLRASAAQVALVATLPNLIGSAGQLLSAWLAHRLSRRRPLIVGGALLQAAVLLPTALLPLLFPQIAIPFLLICLSLYYGAANFIAPQWMSLMGELVPERRRGRFFARRTALAQITAFAALFAAGLLLNGAQMLELTAWGFGLLFAIAAAARLISAHHLANMHEPHPHAASVEPLHDLRWLRADAYKPALGFSVFFVLMQSAVGISAPFFAIYMLDFLQFSYVEFMANTGMSVLVQFLTLRYWGRIGDVMGNRLVLRTTGLVIPALPALWMVSGNFWYLLLVQALSGFAWAGFSLSAGNILYDLVPREKRATYQALQNVVMTAGVFLGSMLGVAVTHHLPAELDFGPLRLSLPSALMWAFMFSALARLFVSALLLGRLPEPRRPRQTASPYQLVYRFTRFNAFSGLLYDIVARVRRTDDDQE